MVSIYLMLQYKSVLLKQVFLDFQSDIYSIFLLTMNLLWDSFVIEQSISKLPKESRDMQLADAPPPRSRWPAPRSERTARALRR